MRAQFLALFALVLVGGCSPPGQQGGQSVGGAAGGEFRMERFCDAPDLPRSQRHTYLLIDHRVLTRAQTPEEFVARNASVRDAVLAIADPGRAIQSGAADYRERISIFLLPPSGGAAQQIFEGCVPAMSPQELAQSRNGGSAVGTFFTGGVEQTLRNDADAFRARIVAAIVLAARSGVPEGRPETGLLAQSGLVESLRASGRLVNGDDGLPRIVLLSNLAHVDLGGATTREQVRTLGFAQGREAALDLGRSELHILLSSGPAAGLARDYVDAFFLAQHAHLSSWSSALPTAMPAAPVWVRRFDGEASYPGQSEAVQIRIASDRNGRLVNSWLLLRGNPDRSTPMSGQRTCTADNDCSIRSDESGFAQAWSLAPGGEPEFNSNWPFGGMRDWEFTFRGVQLQGRVLDPAVQIGADSSNNSISISGRLSNQASF